MATFDDKICLDHTSGRNVELDPSVSVRFECFKIICYLGDMLNGEGGVDSSAIARVRCKWKKCCEQNGIMLRK